MIAIAMFDSLTKTLLFRKICAINILCIFMPILFKQQEDPFNMRATSITSIFYLRFENLLQESNQD